MIEMSLENINGIEVIHAAPAGKRQQPLPTIFFYHGYTSSKEVYSYFAYAFAQAGFRTIVPDADMHGARFEGNETRRLSHFWEILKSNIDELPAIKQHYQQAGLIEGERIGVAGASMGGMTTLGAFARYPWVSVAADFMGSGYFTSLAHTLFPPLEDGREVSAAEFERRLAPLTDYDLTHQLEKIADRPLLVWHGEADEVVPAAESARLVQALQISGRDKHLTYLTEAGIGHKITPTALAAGTLFFSKYL
ncbi:dienelactone hydrolase family protein [Yersinia rochesterensis]|uniref:Dienelactone hydrolase family protein n=1 Tax=Yersinia rochesterensis TaxID=1604335 RepID=A0A386HAP3_9GAMM|nr:MULTISPECIES: esterase [Yersinia]AJI87024.1 esterase yjfP [Yersinia frederiksenii Y225]CNH12153.1 esterase [Yersinia kristensenii]AIN18324.1 dienelactone hydrolase family protein [Yersinia rochesterensis]AJJ36026.1 dienelactone hydrolase family protein [Yersinia rochesterensis]AYD42693.1 esterase [Yersinia rochesterensis]